MCLKGVFICLNLIIPNLQPKYVWFTLKLSFVTNGLKWPKNITSLFFIFVSVGSIKLFLSFPYFVL